MGFPIPQERKLDYKEISLAAIREHFKFFPEFLDRLDAIVVFKDLSLEVYARILNKFLNEFNENNPAGVYLALTEDLFNFTVEEGSRHRGGRGLRRFFEKHILTPLADVVSDEGGENVFVGDINCEGNVFFWKLVKPKIEVEEKKENEKEEDKGEEKV